MYFHINILGNSQIFGCSGPTQGSYQQKALCEPETGLKDRFADSNTHRISA